MVTAEVTLRAPPDLPKFAPVNPLARLLPIGMVVAAAGMMVVYFSSGVARSPMFMFFPVMMVMSVLGSAVYSARGNNRTAELNQSRQRYLRYLDTMDHELAVTAAAQQHALRWCHPEPESLWTLVGGRRMWERRPQDADFGRVRIGCGDQPLAAPMVEPALGPSDELDPVTVGAMRTVVRRRSIVTAVPVTVALPDIAVVTIGGCGARALVRAMVCEMAVMHGPEHLAIVSVPGDDARDEWDWLKWLPHHQHGHAVDGAGPARLVYRTLGTAAEELRSCGNQAHTVMILDGGSSAGIELVSFASGVTVVEIGHTLDAASVTRGLRLHVTADRVSGDAQTHVDARPDGLTHAQAVACARRLARFRPESAVTTSASPASVGWPALMGIDDPGIIDPARLWSRRRLVGVPIGVADDGTPVELDINEAARNGMGPHGLCIGATGSGKSEFLRTLTLGMITVHPPDVLNLVLIDFKGGATFSGFERAQHVSAVITNLADAAHLVARMNDALTGEMTRRQELLRAAGGFANVTEYERARSGGAALVPLPTLFIVVDEFSELLSQHPDFADLFVAIGRLGRSLGVHLLLASQRLDEGRLRGLETHLSYRICLKTFSASESRAVLGVSDAYQLPGAPGAAYLKTASGDLRRFQTAFASGPYRRLDASASAVPLTPQVFTAAPVGPAPATPDTGSVVMRTVLDTVLDRLAGHGPVAHRVWLPPLTRPPTLGDVMRGGDRRQLAARIGLVDSPFQQRRDLLIADLSGPAGNVAVVGAPRAGKSTALRTLILTLAESHAPTEIGFYCLDFGGGALSSLRELPHVGAVATRFDVELCRRTVAVVESVLRERENRFRAMGIDSVAEYRGRRAAGDSAARDDPYGDVFLVVDGWATLRHEFDTLEAPIAAIAAQGLSFGVHVVVAAARWAELRPALKDQVATRIELRLGDPAESEMNRRRARQLTEAAPGRGITSDGREFMVALPRFDGTATDDGLGEAIAADVARLQQRWGDSGVPPVELLPLHIGHRELLERSGEHAAPLLGLDERDLRPLPLDFAEHPHLLVLGDPACGKTSVLRLLCQEIVRSNDPDGAELEIVDFRRSLLGVVEESAHLAGYSVSPPALESRMRTLLDRLTARMPDEAVTQQQLRSRSWWSGPDIYLVIDDYDLVAAATGNPLVPLADFLPYAKDLGLHVLVARRAGGAARAMFDPVLARLRELGCMGLMMSAGPDEGVLLGSVRPTPLPPGRATLITRDSARLVQVAWADPP